MTEYFYIGKTLAILYCLYADIRTRWKARPHGFDVHNYSNRMADLRAMAWLQKAMKEIIKPILP